MLAYAANRRRIGKRQSSPHAMLLIISAHVALVALVMSAKMDLPQPQSEAGRIIRIRRSPSRRQPSLGPSSRSRRPHAHQCVDRTRRM